DGEYLDGDGICYDLNDTIDDRQTSTTYYINTSAVDGGSYTDTEDVDDAWYYDDASLNFTEGSGADPLDVYFNFTEVNDFDQIVIREYYMGSASHTIHIQLWDINNDEWEDHFTFVGQDSWTTITIPIYDSSDHLFDDGNVSIRFSHEQNGITSHRLDFDFVWLVEGSEIGASTNLEGYARYKFGSNDFEGNGSIWTSGNVEGANITASGNYISNGTDWFSLQDLNTTGSGGSDSTFNATYDAFATNVSLNHTDLVWIEWGKWFYNMSNLAWDYITTNEASWLSKYNATYDAFANNVSKNYTQLTYDEFNAIWSSESIYNATYDAFANNVSKNYTQLTYDEFNAIWSSESVFNATYDAFVNNVSINYTDDTWTNWGKWFYNMSDGSYNATYDAFANNVSKNYSMLVYDEWNAIWSTGGEETQNQTYEDYVYANFTNNSNNWDGVDTVNSTII
ncbi:unnamed protein product, partial [marine sediment metagenome]